MTSKTDEFEIKLLFPPEKRKDIEKYLIENGGIRRQHLQAAYIDTPEFTLMRAGIAFRLRKEGRHWIQTLKVSTSNIFERLEHNVLIPASGGALPAWNVNLHQNHNAGKILKKILLKSNAKDLKVVYETDIWRRKALIQTESSCIEYALDCGFISSSTSSGLIKTSVEELEIEFKSGLPGDVVEHARGAIQNYGAYIDVRSKSERGFLLASNLTASPPVKGKGISLKKAKSKSDIVRVLVDGCLTQILSNQSVINAEIANFAEYLHQLRIGLRRLKVALKYLEKNDVRVSEEGINVFKRAFSSLGQYRDNHFVTTTLNPILSSLGGPEIKLNVLQDLPRPSIITRDVGFQLFLIELLSIGLPESDSTQKTTPEKNSVNDVDQFKDVIERLLIDTLKFISERVQQFSALEDEEIHTLRKKMKFLRYSLEFFKDYLSKKKYSKFYKSISESLEHFGLFNDICVCTHRIEGQTESDSNLLFALGWLKAERARVRIVCQKSAKNLIKTSVPWS